MKTQVVVFAVLLAVIFIVCCAQASPLDSLAEGNENPEGEVLHREKRQFGYGGYGGGYGGGFRGGYGGGGYGGYGGGFRRGFGGGGFGGGYGGYGR